MPDPRAQQAQTVSWEYRVVSRKHVARRQGLETTSHTLLRIIYLLLLCRSMTDRIIFGNVSCAERVAWSHAGLVVHLTSGASCLLLQNGGHCAGCVQGPFPSCGVWLQSVCEKRVWKRLS